MSLYLYFIFLSSWFFTSVLIDMVAIPAIFRNVSIISEAGTVGMIVFGKYNILEVLFSLGTLITLWLNRNIDYFKVLFGLLLVLLMIAMAYTFHLSPEITEINTKLYNDETSEQLLTQLQASHDYYHQLYVGIEKAKVLMLFCVLVLSLYLFSKKQGKQS